MRNRRGIARGHGNVFDATADLIRHDLRQRRARALPLGRGAGCHRDLTVGEHAHGHALERPKAGAFHVVCNPDAEVASFAARLALARRKVLVARECERALLAFRKVSARIDERLAVAKDQADGIGHRLERDHVAPAQFGAIELELARDVIHQPLHGEDRLRSAGAAHDRRRHAVGEHDGCLEAISRHHVRPREGRRGDIRHDDAPGQECAGVVQEVNQ